jgi:hypothetical protein
MKELWKKKIGKRLDAFPDKIDLRDLAYHPTLRALPDEIANCPSVPEILDQGTEGACTGFAPAAVINYLLHQRKLKRRIVRACFMSSLDMTSGLVRTIQDPRRGAP